MKVHNHIYHNLTGLVSHIDEHYSSRDTSVLVQIFSGTNEKEAILAITEIILQKIPHAKILGATAACTIADARLEEERTVISFLSFENIEVKTHLVEGDGRTMYQAGKELGENLIREDTKALIVFSHGNGIDSFSFRRLL